jgi:hypothetical protein
MARQSVALLALLLGGCALGNAQWREESYQTTVWLRGAGDGQCSDPAPYTSIRACLLHDAAYSVARRQRCADLGDPGLASEQSRLIADLTLAQQMAMDGYPEAIVGLYYRSVRLGAWWTWHFSPCAEATP